MLGDGAWGTAVASLLATNGYEVMLWCNDEQAARSIATTGYNERYLPGVQLSALITPTTDLDAAMRFSPWIFEAIPVKHLRTVLGRTINCFDPQQTWIILSKGIEQDTLLLPAAIIDDVFGYATRKVIFSGPSFAHDVVRHQLTAVDLASTDRDASRAMQTMVTNDFFSASLSDDPVGIQVGGAVKNVIALGVGLLDGAGYTDNAQAFLLTKGLHEMVRIAEFFGGKPATLYGLAGVGDLVLTALGKHSKNVAFGRRIGTGQKMSEQETQPEGVTTVQSVYQLAQQHNLDLPVCNGVYRVLFQNLSVKDMLTDLMKAS
jgi:glycerol-3-phosphate dehydrogenase (NAD(P)+)